MRREWLVGLPWILLCLAWNPFLAPQTYDNLLYYQGGVSLTAGEGYQFFDMPIVDWPPITSLLMIPAFYVFGSSVWVAKGVIALCVIISCVLVWALFKEERGDLAWITAAVLPILPTSFMFGTRVMSEWPYLLFSLLFFIGLERLKDTRRWVIWVPTCAVLLAVSLMTRYVAVALFVALAWQGLQAYRQSRAPLQLMPELITGVLGALIFVGAWLVPVVWAVNQGDAGSVYYKDASFLSKFSPAALVVQIGDLLAATSKLKAVLGPDMAGGLAVLVVSVSAYGWWRRVRESGFGAVDAYVVAVLGICVCHELKLTRYLLPVAPFLLADLFYGVQKGLRWIRFLHKPILYVFVLAMLMLDGVLLVRGNNSTYGGLLFGLNDNYTEFYRGYWRDLYEASRVAGSQDDADAVGLVDIGDTKYVRYFSGLRVLEKREAETAPYLMLPYEKEAEYTQKGLWVVLYRNDSVSLLHARFRK